MNNKQTKQYAFLVVGNPSHSIPFQIQLFDRNDQIYMIGGISCTFANSPFTSIESCSWTPWSYIACCYAAIIMYSLIQKREHTIIMTHSSVSLLTLVTLLKKWNRFSDIEWKSYRFGQTKPSTYLMLYTDDHLVLVCQISRLEPIHQAQPRQLTDRFADKVMPLLKQNIIIFSFTLIQDYHIFMNVASINNPTPSIV